MNILDLKEDLEEIVGAGLAETLGDLPPDEYMEALEYALEGEAQDILGIDPLYSFRGTMAERAKELMHCLHWRKTKNLEKWDVKQAAFYIC